MLKKKGISFELKNHGNHVIISHNGKMVNWWPQGYDGGKWSAVETNKVDYGIESMFKYLEYEPNS